MKKLLSIALFLLPTLLCAESSGKKKSIQLEGGAYVTQISQRLNAASGTTSQVSTLSGFFRFRTFASLGKNWFFEPGLGTMLPWRAGVDGSTKTFMTHLNLDIAKSFGWVEFRLGPGMFWQWMLSQGETVPLNNGVGETDFYLPQGSSHVFLATADAGLSIRFSSSVFLNADIYALQVLSRERRRFHGTLTLGIRL